MPPLVSEPPTVSVIIPHLRNRSMLERCLDSLRLSTWKSFSVTVVDNGAAESDTQGLEASYPEVTVLCMPVNAGYAGGCNEGLKQTDSDYVVFLNDDTVVDPCWLDHLVAAAGKDEGIGALQPKILSLRAQRRGEKLFDYAGAAGGLIDWLGYPFCLGRNFSGVEEDRGQYDREEEIFWASGVAMFASRAMVERAGGFDADFFMHMEEIDLCWRMKLLGNRICSVPKAVVWHEGGATLREGSGAKIYYNHRNNVAMLLKNCSPATLVAVLPVRMLLEVAAAIYYLTTSGGFDKSRQVFRAAADNLRRLRRTYSKRKEVQQTRAVSDLRLMHGLPLSILFSEGRFRKHFRH